MCLKNNYDTRLLHRNLAFPLPKALADVKEPNALRVFKEEIAKRFESGFKPVLLFLIKEGYLNYLNDEELNTVLEECVDSKMLSLLYTDSGLRNYQVLEIVINNKFEIVDWIELVDTFFYYREYEKSIETLSNILPLDPSSVLILRRILRKIVVGAGINFSQPNNLGYTTRDPSP